MQIMRQIKIEDEVWPLLHHIADDQGVKHYELYQLIIDWHEQRRSQGEYSARTLIPPQNSPLRTLWLTPHANLVLIARARQDQQSINRILYSAIIRYLCHFAYI